MSTPVSGNVDAFRHRFFAASDPARPPLLLLHGTGGNEDDLVPLGEMLLPGAAILSPRGQVLEHGMPRFFRRFAEGVFDLEDLERRTHELADWVPMTLAHYGLGGRRPVAVGYSNGANIAAAMLLLRPEVLAGAVLFRAMTPLEPKTPPDLAGRSIFMASGRDDPFIRAEDSERLAKMLEAAGARVTTRWTDGGHALTPGDVAAAREWLAATRWS
jgi:phospholipase/carboxylesterase